jgi:hypothetical protein
MVATLMAQVFETEYKRVEFTINGSNSQPVYINNGNGYILGTWKDIRLAGRINFDYNVDIFISCKRCGNFFDHPEELTEVDAKKCGGYNKLCATCLSEYQYTCPNCSKVMWYADVENTRSRDGAKFCSPKCYSESFYRKCSSCEEWNMPGTMVWVNDSKTWVCSDCMNKYRSCIFCYHTDLINRFKKVAYHTEGGKSYNVWCCPECSSNIRSYGNPKGDPAAVEVKSKRAKSSAPAKAE